MGRVNSLPTSRCSSRPWNGRSGFRLPQHLFGGVVGSGPGYSRPSSFGSLIVITSGVPTTGWDNRCGCPPRIYQSILTPRNWHPNLLVRSCQGGNPLTIKLNLPQTMHIHPTFHVIKVKPLVESPWCRRRLPRPLLASLTASQPTLLRGCWLFAGGDGVDNFL